MDNLVLTRVVAVVGAEISGSHVEEFRQDGPRRYRLTLQPPVGGPVRLALSLRPELPWLGRPAAPRAGPLWSPSTFARRCVESIRGRRVVSLTKPGPDRVVVMVLGDGSRLVAELATHGANLVLVDSDGSTLAAAHQPPSARDRIRPGSPYAPPRLPGGRLMPFGAAPSDIDRIVRAARAEGESAFEAIRRRLFGIGSSAAELVVGEAESTGRSVGEVLHARLVEIEHGSVDPVIEAREDPLEAADRGALDPSVFRLWPWTPALPDARRHLLARRDAGATAGLWYEAVERGYWSAARADAMRSLLRAEIRRNWEAARRAEDDRTAFDDPERFARWGEALLAGLSVARREGDRIVVPDPYDPDGPTLAIPAESGRSATDVADALFRQHRRACRGLEAARQRASELSARCERLEAVEREAGDLGPDEAGRVESLIADGLRREGVSVSQSAATKAQRRAQRVQLPRVDGVRVFTSRDGLTILVGRTGRDNDRLTFKIAGPDDLWFHARGVAGAHVVVRSPGSGRPPAATLEDAAAVAAWFSDAREEGAVDVQWTRRKNVRRARGRGPGAVLLKRFEVLRVRPVLPARAEGPR